MRNTTETLPHSVELTLRSNDASRVASERHDGRWESVSSNEFLDEVQHFAAGLLQLGIHKGDTVGIIANSSPRWLVVDLGSMAAGCATVPVFVNVAEDNLAYEIEDSGMRAVFVDGPVAYARVQPHLGRLGLVISANVDSDRSEHHLSYQDVIDIGRARADTDPQVLECMLEDLDPNAIATIIYTSGSSGSPKGVELSHANLLSQIRASGQRFPMDPSEDVALSCLPLAHVFERMVVYFYLCSGVPVCFVDDIQNVGTCLKEVRPTTMTMVPRLLEKLYGKLRDGAEAKPLLKRLIARWAIRRAFRLDPDRAQDWRDRLADKLVYSQFRLGLGNRFRRVIAGGAALAPKLHRFYLNIGLPVYQGYGLTEAAPVLATNYPGHNKIGTVGQPFPGVDVKVDESGEILARGENIMLGYHHALQATREVIDEKGWLHTGDLGHLDREGFLVIDGRVKELLKTSNGKYVSPVPIELALIESRLVDTAMVVAEGKPFVSALLFLDPASVGCVDGCVEGETLERDALMRLGIANRLDARIAKVNEHLNAWERIRDYRCIYGLPSIEREELTPTMKIRRHVVEGRYQAEINAIYSSHGNIMGV
ncbi:long-chain fatty acid--CoA ligase [Pelagicoccus sp. SDUM812005]|uniref:AMP-dependent synthetase/ligase n=1 Tax=Pelagicoccus sp. SDUM812005 TaxID=3041257 RepID=UPI00280CB94A|nr:long-chain fatty acid--CoA ligase [Pelagicoccus sp. SDUM812005]MDQ8179172.1 long-chain fatty acid--CoA ligase [Pelagicoccus sp. SDUM812005]